MNETEAIEPGLLQLRHRDDPWKMLVCCILLNRTQRKQVDRVVDGLFRWYPTAERMTEAETPHLWKVLRPLGLWQQRAATLVRFSEDWVALQEDVERLGAVDTG